MKIILWIMNILSVAGIIISVCLIILGNQPCSGDGCLIHILYLIGTPVLIVSGLLFYFTFRKLRKS